MWVFEKKVDKFEKIKKHARCCLFKFTSFFVFQSLQDYDKYTAYVSKQSDFKATKNYQKGEVLLRITLINLKTKLKLLIQKLLT